MRYSAPLPFADVICDKDISTSSSSSPFADVICDKGIFSAPSPLSSSSLNGCLTLCKVPVGGDSPSLSLGICSFDHGYGKFGKKGGIYNDKDSISDFEDYKDNRCEQLLTSNECLPAE